MSARDDAVSAATAAYGDGGYGHAHRMNKAIAAYEAALSAAGFVVVPREPTEAQMRAADGVSGAGGTRLEIYARLYRAMIAAAIRASAVEVE